MRLGLGPRRTRAPGQLTEPLTQAGYADPLQAAFVLVHYGQMSGISTCGG
jgi:hypothetical protein